MVQTMATEGKENIHVFSALENRKARKPFDSSYMRHVHGTEGEKFILLCPAIRNTYLDYETLYAIIYSW